MTGTPFLRSVAPATGGERHSPCLGICHLDTAKGMCGGCGRTGTEIADWPAMTDADRLAVYARLPARLLGIGAPVRLLEWMAGDILAFVHETLGSGAGAWIVGAPGEAGLVAVRDLAGGSVRAEADAIAAEARHSRDGGITLRIATHDKLRAFAIQEQGRDGLVVLGLPRGRVEQILAARSKPPRDWLTPPGEVAHDAGCACCNMPGIPLAPAAAATHYATALATLSIDTPSSGATNVADAVMARAKALPRYAVAMAVFDPAG